MQVICYKCQSANEYSERLSFRAECESCGEDLHICRNCRFYDPKVYNECRETQADVVKEKERANRCEYFEVGGSGRTEKDAKQDLLAAAEALFKKK